jgi:hypothetical protein
MSYLEIEEFNVYAGRVFTEDYFIEKYGNGLPYEIYELLTKRANEQMEIIMGKTPIKDQKHLMNDVLKELSSLKVDNE